MASYTILESQCVDLYLPIISLILEIFWGFKKDFYAEDEYILIMWTKVYYSADVYVKTCWLYVFPSAHNLFKLKP